MIGCIAFTLMFFRHPFYNSSKVGIIHVSIFWPEEINYSENLISLVRNLLTPNPSIRMNMSELIDYLTNWDQSILVQLNQMALKIQKEQNKEFINDMINNIKLDKF